MFLRATPRKKDGKIHRYWSVVENRRVKGGRVAQRHVLYLGEINDAQRAAWCKSIAVLEEGQPQLRQMAIFPEQREAPELSCAVVHVKLDGMRLAKPRQWGACWLGMTLWEDLQLDAFWSARLGRTREGTEWLAVLKTLAMYRLIDPGSEWRLHRQWYERSAMADLLGADQALAQPNTLYRCLDLLLPHKQALFTHLKQRWETLFQASFEILLYDLTSTYFECEVPESGKRRFGYALLKITLPPAAAGAPPKASNPPKGSKAQQEPLVQTQSFEFTLNRQKLRVVRRREGRYLLRTNLTAHAPALLWQFYIQLTEVEQAFKELKNDLAIRPVYHQKDERIEAHIFVSFLAYCLQVTLKARLKPLAGGLTPRAVLEKFAAVQMLDVHLPTTDGRELVLTRHTEPDADLRLLLAQMKLDLPAQPPPKIGASRPESMRPAPSL
jgi:hypothetical protein